MAAYFAISGWQSTRLLFLRIQSPAYEGLTLFVMLYSDALKLDNLVCLAWYHDDLRGGEFFIVWLIQLHKVL